MKISGREVHINIATEARQGQAREQLEGLAYWYMQKTVGVTSDAIRRHAERIAESRKTAGGCKV